MGAVYAQFVTPFDIADTTESNYAHVAYLRMPRDAKYQPPSPERPFRGWLVVRGGTGVELFRSDINLFMDGGVGVLVEDAGKLSDAMLKSAVGTMTVQDSAEVMSAILQRLEAMHSPWARINFAMRAAGTEVFHENEKGQRTTQRFVVDLRLERIPKAASRGFYSTNY